MSLAPTRKRGGGSARLLTCDELTQIEAAKALLKEALEARWPLRDRWGDAVWRVMRSRSQDGQSLRLAVIWDGGPTMDEVIRLAESLSWPAGTKVTLSLRRRPEADPRHPHLHRIQR
jgi:hypothetical protein